MTLTAVVAPVASSTRKKSPNPLPMAYTRKRLSLRKRVGYVCTPVLLTRCLILCVHVSLTARHTSPAKNKTRLQRTCTEKSSSSRLLFYLVIYEQRAYTGHVQRLLHRKDCRYLPTVCTVRTTRSQSIWSSTANDSRRNFSPRIYFFFGTTIFQSEPAVCVCRLAISTTQGAYAGIVLMPNSIAFAYREDANILYIDPCYDRGPP